MRKYSSILIYLVTIGYSFLFSIHTGLGQANFPGAWEGTFMNDFQTIITFSSDNENKFKGNIKMFDGDNLIQDDILEKIQLANQNITFIIPAKETSFKGSFNNNLTELSGQFFFPDGSKHPIQLKRKSTKTTTVEDFLVLKEKKFEVQDLHSDLLFLFAKLKEHHPRLYEFLSKDSLDLQVENILRKINEPLTLEEFYLYAAKLSSAVNCSHTGVKLPTAYQILVNRFGNYFPLKLFFADGTAFYISGLRQGDHELSPANEVISINNKPINEIINQLFYFIPSEGCNTTTKYNILNKRFNTLFYHLDNSEQFNVRFKTGDTIKHITVSSSNLSEINFDSAYNDKNKEVDFTYINKKQIASLKITSFAIADMDLYFHQLDRTFRDLKANNIQNLILDLRDNSGGHPIFAAQLLSYLTDGEFTYFKRNEAVKDFEPLYNTMQPNKLNFSGNVYVFINGGCLSTTGHLISLLKYYTSAMFVGEEPGSTFRCNDFSMQMNLPKTGIVMNVPRTTFETSVSGFALCEPFHIDYRIHKNVNNVINREDPYLEMLLSKDK